MKVLSVVFALLVATGNIYAQDEPSIYKLKEKLTIEINRPFFVPGEELQVAIHSDVMGAEFAISRVAYLELFDDNNQSVLQEKARLLEGRGTATLYLPSYLKTGNYTLLIYTRWMKNFDHNVMGRRTITIVNPFIALPPSLFKRYSRSDSVEIEFYPEGGSFFEMENQKIGYRVVNQFGENVAAHIQIKSPDTTVLDVDNKTGQGTFTLSPAPNTEYSVTVADTLDRIFFSRIKTGHLLKNPVLITQGNGDYKLSQLNNVSKIAIHTANQRFDYEVNGRGELLLNKSDLPAGLLQLDLYNDAGGRLYSTCVFNEPERERLNARLSSSTLATRQEMTLHIDGPASAELNIIVRKKQELTSNENLVKNCYIPNGALATTNWPEHSIDNSQLIFIPEMGYKEQSSQTGSLYLPDFRGELIQGTLTDNENRPAPHRQFYLTTEGKRHMIYSGSTDSLGKFYMSVDPEYEADKLIFSGVEGLKANIDDPFLRTLDGRPAPPLRVSRKNLEEWLVSKSVEVQVQNLYSSIPDKQQPLMGLFDGQSAKQSFNLDEYARFPTLSDPILEYIPQLVIRKNDSGREFYIRNMDNRAGEYNHTLTTLNGMVCTPDFVLDLNQSLIQRIEVYSTQFTLGSETFTGAVNFLTYPTTDVSGLLLRKALLVQQKSVQNQTLIPNQQKQSVNPSVPDLRVQLLWAPHLRVGEKGQDLRFLTSDISGDFEVIISGVADGRYVFERLEFQVSPMDK